MPKCLHALKRRESAEKRKRDADRLAVEWEQAAAASRLMQARLNVRNERIAERRRREEAELAQYRAKRDFISIIRSVF